MSHKSQIFRLERVIFQRAVIQNICKLAKTEKKSQANFQIS